MCCDGVANTAFCSSDGIQNSIFLSTLPIVFSQFYGWEFGTLDNQAVKESTVIYPNSPLCAHESAWMSPLAFSISRYQIHSTHVHIVKVVQWHFSSATVEFGMELQIYICPHLGDLVLLNVTIFEFWNTQSVSELHSQSRWYHIHLHFNDWKSNKL